MELQHVPQHALPLLLLQAAFIVLFAVFAKYSPDADATYHPTNQNQSKYDVVGHGVPSPIYGMFQDVQVMIFVGIGFLLSFLKKYGLGSVSFNFLVGVIAVQWSLLVNGFFNLHDGYIEIGVDSLMTADFMAATALISFGAVLGKVTPLQLIIFTLIEIPIYSINEIIGRKYFGAVDMGYTMFIHTFAAYFGLATSFMLTRKDLSTEKQSSTKTSDLFTMIGTLFLWVYWPSFNASSATGDDQHRVVVNTYLSLAASCIVSFAVSSLLDPRRRLQMAHIQNSTLAGGVVIGTVADMMIQPWGALLLGSIAGVVSVLGFHYLTDTLASKLRVHDTGGIHNLHGMPSVIGGLAGAIYAAVATETSYGVSLYEIFPYRSPVNGSEDLARLQEILPSLEPGEGRTATSQAFYQLLTLAVTLVIGIVGGLITGFILRLDVLNKLVIEELYDDDGFFLREEKQDRANTTATENGVTGPTAGARKRTVGQTSNN